MSTNIKLEWYNDWAEQMQSNAILPILWLSNKGEIINFNQALLNMLQYMAGELKVLTLFDLNGELTKQSWNKDWSALLKHKTLSTQAHLTTKHGKTIHGELNFNLIEVGSTVNVLVMIREVSKKSKSPIALEAPNLLLGISFNQESAYSKVEMQKFESQQLSFDKLQQSENKNQLILDSAGEGIYGLDVKGHTTFVNKAAARMIGWELEELTGQSQHAILHHSKIDGSPYEVTDCPIYAAFKDGKTYTVDDEVFWRKDGTSFPVEYTSTPIKDKDEKLIGAVVVFKDISRRKEAQRALKESNTNLQHALFEVEQLKSRLEHENIYLQEEIKLSNNFEHIISTSKKFKKVLSQVEQVAPTDATVLIMGESGTGKELIARAVHNLSNRKGRPLVKLNCATLPANLIESELFGHERGAFTGAVNNRVGRFELAHKGTIFLDEIGELPIELQSKLLRVLQEGEFERLGSARTQQIDVRVIAATNRDLEAEIARGNFREDLYYRLHVFPIHVPPLRERSEDVPLLVKYFISKFQVQFGKKVNTISKKTMDELINYKWAGNVRELENVIERAVIISTGNKLVLGESLVNKSKYNKNTKLATLSDNERLHILKALEQTTWRVSGERGAAKLLGINRTTLEARMKKLNIKRP